MKAPDILFFFKPEERGQPAPTELRDLAAQGRLVHLQSRPTHVVQVTWTAAGVSPRWVVLLREDDGASILDLDATSVQGFSFRTAVNLLRDLNLPVATGGVNLGTPPPHPPKSLEGVYPGDQEFSALLADPVFVRWLKSQCELVQW